MYIKLCMWKLKRAIGLADTLCNNNNNKHGFAVKKPSDTQDSLASNADPLRYRSFAHLAADWFWELDANLCYVFHDGRPSFATDEVAINLVGRCRINVLDQYASPSDELAEHNQRLRDHKDVDIVLPITNDSGVRYVHAIAQAQFDDSGVFKGYRGCSRDVTRRVELETKLAHLATHDDLTGIINRREFERKLARIHNQAKTDEAAYSLCFIDLDRFKQVNDTGGHHAGDQLLRELVGVIRKHVHSDETLARLGGDEFGLVLHSDASAARNVSEKIIDEISRYQFNWEGQTFCVGASIGIVEITKNSESVDSLMVKADNACYMAKHNGRNQSHVSDEELPLAEPIGMHRVNMVRHALENNHYKLLMQPIVSLSNTEAFTRYELLIRLSCENGELLEPGAFMPMARKYSLMQELDCWVVENALHALESLHAAGEDVAMSINLSAKTLADPDALARIIAIHDRFDTPKQRVCFDITETYAIRNIESVASFMDSLKAKGVEFALDDFGNGLCSFTYLRHLPINYLKIDGELIRNLAADETVRCITSSFHELGKKLGIKTVAESVEDSVTIALIKEIGIDYMQGFGVAPLVELEAPSVLTPVFSIVQ